MLSLIYTALIRLLAPFALLVTAWRGIRDKAYRDRLAERFGFTSLRFERQVIWVHAVSMGEVQAAAPLVRELRVRYPQLPLLITTVTPTGAQRVRSLFGDTVWHAYLPYDTPGAVQRFIQRVRPCIAIVMETEVWPNLFRACARRRVPIVLASARLSEKSARRLRWWGGLFRPVLAMEITIAAQTAADAERFVALGADRKHVSVVGNIKFDQDIPHETQLKGRALRESQFPHRFVWVAGSTHELEEQIILDAHLDLCMQLPGALLVLVPRHPQRFEAVARWLRSQGIAYASRSTGQALGDGNNVLLVDTMGELQMFYAAADVAFVGGTLVPVGGHNLLEPAAMAMPVLAGPHNFNAPDIAQLLFANGAARQVQSTHELSTAVVELALNATLRRRMGLQGRQIVEANRGAMDKVLALVDAAVGTVT